MKILRTTNKRIGGIILSTMTDGQFLRKITRLLDAKSDENPTTFTIFTRLARSVPRPFVIHQTAVNKLKYLNDPRLFIFSPNEKLILLKFVNDALSQCNTLIINKAIMVFQTDVKYLLIRRRRQNIG